MVPRGTYFFPLRREGALVSSQRRRASSRALVLVSSKSRQRCWNSFHRSLGTSMLVRARSLMVGTIVGCGNTGKQTTLTVENV